MNLYKSLKKPILLAFNSGSAGRSLEQLDFERVEFSNNKLDSSKSNSENLVNLDNLYNRPLGALTSEDQQKYEDAVVDMAMHTLRQIYGKDVTDPTNAVVTRWVSDPFTRGSYSFPAVGSIPTDYKNIAQNVDGRLFFAGEATEPYHWGTVHGAYLSGIRAANEIDYWYNWHTIHEKGLFVIAAISMGLAGAWAHVLRWRTKRRIALEALDRSHEVAWRSTLLIVISVVFVAIIYYWLELSVGAIPDVFDYIQDWDDECYTISRLLDALPYMQLTPQEEEVYYQQFQRCIET